MLPLLLALLTTLTLDLDGDGAVEVVEVHQGEERAVLRVLRGSSAPWTSDLYPLWSAQGGDLDGDGRAEVVLGLWGRGRGSASPRLPRRRVIWVLGWRGDRLVELWRGTALARPLRDARVIDLDGDGRAELVALEERPPGDRCRVYRWGGFGFTGAGRLDEARCRTLGLRPGDP